MMILGFAAARLPPNAHHMAALGHQRFTVIGHDRGASFR